MKRTVNESVEIPLSVCETLIEPFEMDSYDLEYISPADLVQELQDEVKKNRDKIIRGWKNRSLDNDLPSPDQSEDEIEKSRESVRTKIERNKELLTIDLTYFLNKVIITLSNQERLNYLNYSPLAEKFTFDICEVVKKQQPAQEVWEYVTRLITYTFGLTGRLICLTYWANDHAISETAYYLTGPDKEGEKEKERPINFRLWFSLSEVVQRLRPLGLSKEDIYYLCTSGEIECCVDMASLDRPVRSFELNTKYQNKVTRLVEFDRVLPFHVEEKSPILSLKLRFIIHSLEAPLSRFLALDNYSISKILYQGYCDDWEGGINGFEALFGDTHPDYDSHGEEHFKTIRLSEEHLIVTAKEIKRLESKYSENQRTVDSDNITNGAWKMMGVLLDLLKKTEIYTSDNDIKAAILAVKEQQKLTGVSQRNLDTFFKKANESIKNK